MTAKLDKVFNYVGALVSAGIFFVVAVAAVTMWGIGKSRERTECYKAAAAVSDCAEPGVAERALRMIVGPQGIN